MMILLSAKYCLAWLLVLLMLGVKAFAVPLYENTFCKLYCRSSYVSLCQTTKEERPAWPIGGV